MHALSLWPFGVLTEMIDDGILKVETRNELLIINSDLLSTGDH